MNYPVIGRGFHQNEHERMREELRKRLAGFEFTHFITLTANHQPISYSRMRDRLREWDARINRYLNGPKWQKRPDERLLWFAFPEKLEVNPHWHLIAQVDPDIENTNRLVRTERLPLVGERFWLELLPQGSFDCQDIDSKRVIQYVTKAVASELYFEKFVVFREFMSI